MTIYDNSTGTWPPVAPGVPLTAPHIQSLMLPAGVACGHWYTANLNSHGWPVARGETRVDLFVTGDGHWGLNTDPCVDYSPVCRGCRRAGDDADGRCPKPPTAQDIASALLADFPRPKPVAPRALYAGVSA